MEFVSIQAGVLALISQLERAGLGQVEGLSQLVSVAMVDQTLDLQGLRHLVQNANTDRIRSLVDFANRRYRILPFNIQLIGPIMVARLG